MRSPFHISNNFHIERIIEVCTRSEVYVINSFVFQNATILLEILGANICANQLAAQPTQSQDCFWIPQMEPKVRSFFPLH